MSHDLRVPCSSKFGRAVCILELGMNRLPSPSMANYLYVQQCLPKLEGRRYYFLPVLFSLIPLFRFSFLVYSTDVSCRSQHTALHNPSFLSFQYCFSIGTSKGRQNTKKALQDIGGSYNTFCFNSSPPCEAVME